jgi:hypothetical protein
MRIEGNVRAWAFGIMEWTGTLDLRGGEAAAGDVRRRQPGSVCVLTEHLNRLVSRLSKEVCTDDMPFGFVTDALR